MSGIGTGVGTTMFAVREQRTEERVTHIDPEKGFGSHARQRARERFGIRLSIQEEQEVVDRIRYGTPVKVEEQKAENRTVFRMVIKNRVMYIVFSWRTMKVVTVMPTWYKIPTQPKVKP